MKKFTFGYITSTTVYSNGEIEETYGGEVIERYHISTSEGIDAIQKRLNQFCKTNAGICLSAADWEFEKSESEIKSRFPKNLHEWFEIDQTTWKNEISFEEYEDE